MREPELTDDDLAGRDQESENLVDHCKGLREGEDDGE